MKMYKVVIFITVVFFILVFEIIFKNILPFYIQPNLWLSYIVFLALFMSHTEAVTGGFFLGIIYDTLHLTVFGVNILLFSTIGYIMGWFNKKINEKLSKVQILTLFIGNMIYYLIMFVLVIFNVCNYNLSILKILYSTLLTVLIGYFELQILYKYYKMNSLIS